MSDSLLYFIQQVINGLTHGSTYALIAIGYTMVYGIIGMINFAHGEIYMLGMYLSFIGLAALSLLGISFLPLMILLALAFAILVSCSYGWAVERVAYRPLRGSNRLIPLISAIGVSIFLQNFVRLTQGSRDVAIPSLVNGSWSWGAEDGFLLTLSHIQVLVWLFTVVSMIALTLFISRSRTGRACRAVAQDMKMASLLGIDTNRIVATTFVIGAALAAVAGMMIGLLNGSAEPHLGFIAGLKAFTAAVLGGIGSIPGAMLGGLILGISESMTSGYFAGEYKDVVSFGLLITILLFKPTGILGKPEVEKI